MTAAWPDQSTAIDEAVAAWRQGDVALQRDLFFVHIADLARPLTPEARATAADSHQDGVPPASDVGAVFSETSGLVVLTQTCDIVRPCAERPYVEMAPLLEVAPEFVEEARRMRRPAFAYVPGVADRNLIAHLDRTMTIEKAILARWPRISGCSSDDETRAFAAALARKRSRFAFPNDFVEASQDLQERLRVRHNKNHPEGAHLRALREIRVRAAPSWDNQTLQLTFWFIRDIEPDGHEPAWSDWVKKWVDLFRQTGRFRIELAIPCRLEDITARDYVESDHLDLDQLSSLR